MDGAIASKPRAQSVRETKLIIRTGHLIHIAAIIWLILGSAFWPEIVPSAGDVSAGQIVALVLPLASLAAMVWIIGRDKTDNLGGLRSVATYYETRRAWDYADSAIARQSIHAAIAIGIIALLGDEKREFWNDFSGNTVVAACTVGMLGISTLLCLVSVLCYAYSKHWAKSAEDTEEPKIKRDLLFKAFHRDQQSWYSFMIGLIWAVALASPIVSIIANFFYNVLLSRFYFFEPKYEQH